jgi:hypothetical protein
MDAHVVCLNPQIPLEAFLPPQERNFRDTHFIGSRHDGEFTSSVFFIHVHAWSLKLLIKAMAVPMIDELAELGSLKDQRALGFILNETEFRDAVVYQPWHWFDASETDGTISSASKKGRKKGTMLAQFPASLKGSRWKRLADCLDHLYGEADDTSTLHKDTFYAKETKEFWSLAQDVNFMFLITKEVQKNLDDWNDDVAAASSRLEDVMNFELDQKQQAVEAIQDAKKLVTSIKIPHQEPKVVDKGQWIEPE